MASHDLSQKGVLLARASDYEDAQVATLRALLLAAASSTLLSWLYVANLPQPDYPLIACLIAVTFGFYLIWRIPPSHLTLARWLFLAACFVEAGLALSVGRLPLLVLVVPVLAAGALLVPWAAVPAAFLASALAFALGRPQLTGGSWAAAASLILVGACLWCVLSPLHSLVKRYSQRSLEATMLAEQLRDQKGKLNRTVKDLDASYQLLRQTNRELALARQEADSLRELRSRFATNLSHELRTPLNIILGFSHLIYINPELYGYPGWSDALRRDLAEIQRNASYLAQLLDDIIDLARVDAFAMPINRQMSSMRAVMDETLEAVHSLADAKGLTLSADCAPNLPLLPFDPVRIRQVLFNLVTNAIRYTDQGGIAVTARQTADEVVVSVADTGCGIPKAELATIFNEFYQVGRPKQGPDSGKGLGLAIAKRFVQLHGGRIWAESDVGQGSTFSFSLPLTSKSVAWLRPGGFSPPTQTGKRPPVLVLNDDGTATGYLNRRIAEYQFLPVETPAEAASLLEQQHPLAVVLNRSPGGDGSHVRDALPAIPGHVPLIECALPAARWLFGGERFAAVLSKPVTPSTLLDTLAKAIPASHNDSSGDRERRVLVVDDDRGFVHLVRRMLQAAPAPGPGYRVSGAFSAEEALRKLAHSQPDVILADLRLPGMSGLELVAQMRQSAQFSDIPVIAVTAATPGEDEVASVGAFFSLAKGEPFRPGELTRLLAAALEVTAGDSGAS